VQSQGAVAVREFGFAEAPHGFVFDVLLRRSEVEGAVRERVKGVKFDMGGGVLPGRGKQLEDVPLEVIGELVASMPVDVYIRRIEKTLAEIAQARAAKKPAKAKPTKPKKKAAR
jgi:hypothetical protein